MKKIINKLIKPFNIKICRIKEQRSTMNESLRWLSENGFKICTVLDVGASDGRWSADCMIFFTDANYVLFEPQPVHAEALESFARSCKNSVVIIDKAVGGSEGHTFFNVKNPFGGSLTNKEDGFSIQVPVTTIDSAVAQLNFPGPYLLKLDTHGFEKMIIDGASSTLKFCEIIIVEVYNYKLNKDTLLFWEMCTYLDVLGFRPVDLIDVLHRKYDNSLWQMDIVFVKKDWTGFLHNQYV